MPVYVSAYQGQPPQPAAVAAAETAGLNWRARYLGKRGRGGDDTPDGTDDDQGRREFAIVWTSGAVSGTGIWLLANAPGDILTNARRNAINAELGTTFPSGTTLRTVLRYLVRHMPRRFRQVPIGYDGMCRLTLSGYLDEWSQDDDPVQALDPPEADSYPPLVRT
jgi:hypothetical protein